MAINFVNVPSWDVWSKKSSSFLQKRANKPKLVVIDNLIKNYIPGSRDQLKKLSDALLDWASDKIDRAVDTGRLEAIRALEEVVQRKLREIDKRKYQKVACIAFQIQTGEFDSTGPGKKVQYRGFDITTMQKRLDVNQEARIDINDRANFMKMAIRLAYNQYSLPERDDAIAYLGNQRGTKLEREAKTLKLFMAPEFFFRGKRGAYPIENAFDVLPKIREETSNHKYDDWLFVPGSVVCYTTKTNKDDTKEVGVIMDNIAMVQKGGFAAGDGVHDFHIEKENISGIDYRFIGGRAALTGDTDLHRALEPEVTPQKVPKPLKERGSGGCIFELDDITFGLEVCLDHKEARLFKATDKDGVQIHLIPSAGMSIIQPNCVANAIVFNVDSTHTQLIINDGKSAPEWLSSISVESDPELFPGNGLIHFAKPLQIP